MMAGFVAVCIAIVLTGKAVADRLFAREDADAGTAERIAAAGVIGAALWLAVLWALAIAHQLNRRNLIAAVIAFAIAALFSVRGVQPRRISRWTAAALLPVALWTIFILWRSAVLPPQNHDAMTYHLPKAVLMLQAGGFERFASPDMRIVTFPADYELLLSSVLILEGSDQLTEWIGTAFYLLFLACVAMVAERWWGGGPHVAACVLVAAGMPLLLLHSGADKNDVMTAVFACGAVFWAARWCVARGAAALILATLCGAMTVGTKLTAGGIAPALAPFVIVAIVRRRPSPRHIALTAAFCTVAFLLLGGWVFVSNATAPVPLRYEGEGLVGGVPVLPFANWDFLWRIPYALIRVSLGFHAAVPWPRYNVFNSNFGVPFVLAALFLPIAIWRYRRDGDAGLRQERLIATAAAMLSLAIFYPFVPRHTFAGSARYSIVIVPFVLAWSIAAPLRTLSSRLQAWIMAALVVVFGLVVVDVVRYDTFVPPAYLRWAMTHPGTRRPSRYLLRAATYADAVAGPHDTIAFLGGADGWIYPLYGSEFTRQVRHLPYGASLRDVPADAAWLVIDRQPVLGHLPAPADVRLMNEALATGRFRRVYYDRFQNQVVLQRTMP